MYHTRYSKSIQLLSLLNCEIPEILCGKSLKNMLSFWKASWWLCD